jgi:hypothetical protein
MMKLGKVRRQGRERGTRGPSRPVKDVTFMPGSRAIADSLASWGRRELVRGSSFRLGFRVGVPAGRDSVQRVRERTDKGTEMGVRPGQEGR